MCFNRAEYTLKKNQKESRKLLNAMSTDLTASPAMSVRTVDLQDPDEELLPNEEIKFSAVLSFPVIFWVLTLSCLTVYCTVLPFNNIAAGFIKTKWLSGRSDADTVANNIMMVTYLTAGLLSPFLGALIDRVGFRYFHLLPDGD